MLDSALGWVGQVAEWFGRFVPRREILDTTEGAIKYKRGAYPVFCGPGLHWWWPWSSTFARHPMARQTDRLETQTMETSDGKTFLASGTITYVVVDLLAFVTALHSPLTTVVDTAALALHDVCCDFTWADLQGEQRRGTLKTKLRNEAQKQLGQYGLQVLKLQLNTLARCRTLKISQSISSEEN